MHECNESVRDFVFAAAKKAMQFWPKAHIPIRETKNIVTLVEKLHIEWKSIQRNVKHRNKFQTEKEDKI